MILVDTGIALLAYKDGITESKTLSSVVYSTIGKLRDGLFEAILITINLHFKRVLAMQFFV